MEGRGDSLAVDEAFTAALSLMIGRHAGSDVSGRRIGREAVPIRRARRLLDDKFMQELNLQELAESGGFSRVQARQSVVEGKSVRVRVDVGGGRYITKKK